MAQTPLDRAVKFVTDMMKLSESTYYSPKGSTFAAQPVLHATLTTTFTGRSILVNVSRFGGLTGEDIAAILKAAEAWEGNLSMTTTGGADVNFA